MGLELETETSDSEISKAIRMTTKAFCYLLLSSRNMPILILKTRSSKNLTLMYPEPLGFFHKNIGIVIAITP